MDGQQPLVSICVISYNSSEFVLETLESAKAQTYKNIELIISDDGSSDNTIEICKNWLSGNKERFVRTELITVEKNTGIPANCNRAVKAAKGKWIKLIAADDILLEDCIIDNIEYVRNHPKIMILFSTMQPFLEENGERKFLEPVKLSQPFLDLTADQQFVEIIFGKMPGVAPTAFIAQQLYEELDYYDEEFKLAEDYPFWLKCTSHQHRFVAMDKLTVLYRRHDNNTGIIKVVNGTIYKDRIQIFNQYLNRIIATEYSTKELTKYYKANYLSFIHYGNYSYNIEALKALRQKAEIGNTFYRLVSFNLFLFKKANIKSRILKGIYYRILYKIY